MKMNDKETLELLNLIGKEAINIKKDFKAIDDPLQPLTAMGVDSLDFITVFIYIGDIFGISDEEFNTHPNITPSTPRPLLIEDLIVCINDTATLHPTLEEAIEQI